MVGLKVKGKAIPLQVWTDLEGSRRLRLPYFRLKVGLPFREAYEAGLHVFKQVCILLGKD